MATSNLTVRGDAIWKCVCCCTDRAGEPLNLRHLSSARLAIEPLIQYVCTADKQPLQSSTLLRAGTSKESLDTALAGRVRRVSHEPVSEGQTLSTLPGKVGKVNQRTLTEVCPRLGDVSRRIYGHTKW
jgi:hypothetical protein